MKFLDPRPVKRRISHSQIIFKLLGSLSIHKGTTQGSVSDLYLFNLFINDLYLVNCPDASLSKDADDTMTQVIVNKAGTDCASNVFCNTLAGQVLTICLAIYPSVKN